ncbi:hypothetical protein Tco_1317134 [Tanacetum coccineum]
MALYPLSSSSFISWEASLLCLFGERKTKLNLDRRISLGELWDCQLGNPIVGKVLVEEGGRICPKLPDQPFDIPSSTDEEIMLFIYELGYTGNIETLPELVVDHMHQPWKTFAAVINMCLFGKTTRLDNLRSTITSQREPCPILDSQRSSSITSSHKTNMLNEDILNSTAYQTYYAYASGAKEPKKARKFKKPASPKLKTVPVSPKESTKKPAKAKKDVPSTKKSATKTNISTKSGIGHTKNV